MHLIDRAARKILPNRRHPSANPYVPARRRFLRLLQGRLNPIPDKVKSSATLHLERSPRMMRQHKNRHMIRRLLPPPSLPRLGGSLVRTRAPHRPKHVPAENPGADILQPLRGHFVIDTASSATLPLHRVPHFSLKEPGENLRPADP